LDKVVLESVFVSQQATLITHAHFDRKKLEPPCFHIWPLLCTYRTAEEAIARWQNYCQHLDNDKCCTPGHHFVRITRYPLNTPESYYQKWKTEDRMAQYCYLQDELANPDDGFYAELSRYFGDDGQELAGVGDLGVRFRQGWLAQHGYIKSGVIVWPSGDNPNGW